MIIYRTGSLRESDTSASATVDSMRKWQLTRPLPFLLVAVFTGNIKIITLLLSDIRHRTAENNQRHLSHGFKNIVLGDRGPNMHCVECFFLVVKAELRKFGEVRSHPPHPPWLRHCNVKG